MLKFFEFQSILDISKVQDDEVGDGTTSVVVLACELLRVIKALGNFIRLLQRNKMPTLSLNV